MYFNQYVKTCRILHFEHQDYELRNHLLVIDLENLTVVGNGAVINCQNSESLLVFAHITVLTVSNITLVNCGATFTILNITDTSSLLLYNVTTVQISNVLFNNSNGYAVYVVGLQKVIFMNIFCQNYNVNSSGGIMMVYSNMLTNTITSHDVIQSSHVVIDHCKFYSSYPYIISRNTSIHLIPTIVLKQETGSVKINIFNTHFVSNNRPSISISYYKNTQSTINMFNCAFINNNNNSRNSVIIVKSNNVTTHDMSVSSHTLLMQNCSLVSPKYNFIIKHLFMIGVSENSVTMTFNPLLLYKRTRFSIKVPWNIQISTNNRLNSSPNIIVGEVRNMAIENVSKLTLKGITVSLLEYTFTDSDDKVTNNSSICYCEGNYINCSRHITIADGNYPGQSISIPLITPLNFNTSIYVASPELMDDIPVCETVMPGSSQQLNFVYQHCTNISYTIKSKFTGDKWCLLYLKTIVAEDNTIYAYNITLQDCPLGLIPNYKKGVCVCDPRLEAKGIKCSVSDGTFSTPPYTWISGNQYMTEIMYTTECYLDYCLARISTGIHLNEPQLQCANNRTGVMCGECEKGYSTIFGGTSCKKCTNTWLFLTAVCAVAGILLVVLLFLLNLTVVDGDIYGVLVCVNTLSVYTSRVFPSQHTLVYLPIMLTNLDIGVEVCFYDGMTSYHTIWLQLIFPFYVILIVIGLSFASRYVAFIEKLTRKRVIPVIATLYIFALNKMMLVTGKGLFAYRSVHFLRSSEHWSKLYWSLDSSIELF